MSRPDYAARNSASRLKDALEETISSNLVSVLAELTQSFERKLDEHRQDVEDLLIERFGEFESRLSAVERAVHGRGGERAAPSHSTEAPAERERRVPKQSPPPEMRVVQPKTTEESRGAISTCTPLACEACLWFLQDPACVLDEEKAQAAMEGIVAYGSSYSHTLIGAKSRVLPASLMDTSQDHLYPDEVLTQRRFRTLKKLPSSALQGRADANFIATYESGQSVVKRVGHILDCLAEHAAETQTSLCTLLCRPPETITCLALVSPASGQVSHALFDANPREDREGAGLLLFATFKDMERYIRRLWEVDERMLLGVSNYNRLQLESVEFIPLYLAPEPEPRRSEAEEEEG